MAACFGFGVSPHPLCELASCWHERSNACAFSVVFRHGALYRNCLGIGMRRWSGGGHRVAFGGMPYRDAVFEVCAIWVLCCSPACLVDRRFSVSARSVPSLGYLGACMSFEGMPRLDARFGFCALCLFCFVAPLWAPAACSSLALWDSSACLRSPADHSCGDYVGEHGCSSREGAGSPLTVELQYFFRASSAKNLEIACWAWVANPRQDRSDRNGNPSVGMLSLGRTSIRRDCRYASGGFSALTPVQIIAAMPHKVGVHDKIT